jgi:hypothetical protein
VVGERRVLFLARDVPALGYRTFWLRRGGAEGDLRVARGGLAMENAAVAVALDETGAVRSLRDRATGAEMLDASTANGELRATIHGRQVASSTEAPALKLVEAGPVRAVVEARGRLTDRTAFANRVALYAGLPRVVLETDLTVGEQLDGLMMGALRRVFTPALGAAYFHDGPFQVARTAITNAFPKTHPFPDGARQETLRNHVTGLNFLDCQGPHAGLMYAHNGNQGFLRDGRSLANILSLYDPWDSGWYPTDQSFRSALIAHGAWANSDRLRAAVEFNTPLVGVAQPCRGGPLPEARSWLKITPGRVVLCSLYGDGGDLVARLYDVDGKPGQVTVETPTPLAAASLEDLKGRRLGAAVVAGNRATFRLAAYRIATLRLTLRR